MTADKSFQTVWENDKYSVPGTDWSSLDGMFWFDSHGDFITDKDFWGAKIYLIGGPRDGDVVSNIDSPGYARKLY